jgi:hypothetical protein
VDAVVKYRWIIITIVIIITAFLGYQIKDVKINSDIINSLPDTDPDAVMIKDIGNKFGGNKMGIVILETDDLFKTEVIEHILQITDTLKEIEGISSVTSLTDIIDIKGGDFGIDVGKLVDEYDLPDTPEELEQLRERVFSKDLYKGSVVSADGTATLIIFTLYDDAHIQTVARTVKDKTQSLNLPEKLYYAGSPMLVSSISDLIRDDLIRLIPITFALIAFILFLGFRSKRGIIMPLLIPAISIVWTIGLMVVVGSEMTMVSNSIPIILLAIGSAYMIHVLNRINRINEEDPKKAVVEALKYVLIPVFLAAITTAIGFMSFIFGSYLTIIRDFGLFTAIGTVIAALLSLFFAPAVISNFSSIRNKRYHQSGEDDHSFVSTYILKPLVNLLFKHPKYITVTWSLLVLIGIGGIFLVKRSVDIKEYFKKDNPTRVADNIMTQKFGGTKPVYVIFKGDMQSPEVLKTIVRTEEYMKASDDILTTMSVADLISELNDAMGEGKRVPDERDKIEQLWFLIDGNEMLQRFVSDDLDEGIIISTFVSSDNKSKKEFARYMDKFIKDNSTEECVIAVTGMPYVDITMDTSLIRSQIGSITIALIMMIIIVGLILRSFGYGVFATLPIIATIIILFGIMGFTGIPLNMATVLVASVALGIGIDYSIHVISHFNHSIKKGNDLNTALTETILISGKAIVINVASVSAGFLVLLFSEMVQLQYFGLLVAISMVGSSFGALTLLPVILILVKRDKKS